ncbi:MAG: AAA family ATPase [Microlunatus sp.]
MVDVDAMTSRGTRLLERARQLDVLRAHLLDAAAGRGSLTLVLGEAGVGKTSLVRALAEELPTGTRLLWGSCDALSTPRPLGPLHDIALESRGTLLDAMANERPRYACFTSLVTELKAPQPPALVIIEDVHWADEATRDLLVFLGRRVERTRAAVVVTSRDDELDHSHPLTSTFGQLATLGGVSRLRLDRLGPVSVAALAAGVDAAELFEVTDGNPFFVTEVVAAGSVRGVPVSVRDAVLARAAPLSPAARQVLDAVSLAPAGAVPMDVVLAVASVPPDALDECVTAGMLRARDSTVSFRHELARRAIEDAMPPTRVRDAHVRLLAELERREADPASLAHHAERAGDAERTARYAVVAGDAASRAGAHRSAARQYERALAAGALGPEETAHIWEGLARESSTFGDDTRALAASDQARAAWQRLDRPDDEGRVMANRARVLWDMARGAEAHEAVHEAIHHFDHSPDSRDKAVALMSGAVLLMLADEAEEAVALGWQAARLATDYGDNWTLVRSLNAVGSSLWLLAPDDAEEPLMQARRLAEEMGDDIAVSGALINLGSGAGDVRRYAQADRWLREALAWSADRDLDRNGGYATAWLSRLSFEHADWPRALRLAEQVKDDVAITTRIVALTVIGRVRVRTGRDDADAPLDEAWRLAESSGDLQRLSGAAAGRAELAWLHGHPERIPALVRDTYELALLRSQPWAIGELGFWLWRTGELDALPDGAAAPFAAHVHGELSTAAAVWNELDCPYEAASALADSEEAADLLRALEIFDRLGAGPAADALLARMRSAGSANVPRRPSRQTAANPGGLTARELEVARLVGEGLTDAELGARLHISVKTAGHHVSAILTKLAVASRREVASALTAAEDGELRARR